MTRRAEMALGTAVAALGLLLLLVIIPREIRVVASETNEVSPAYFPRIVAWALVVLGVVHAGLASLSPVATDAFQAREPWLARNLGPARALATFAVGIGYFFLLPGIGYLAATAIAMSVLIVLFGSAPAWRAPLVSLPFAWVVERVFSDLLSTPLPRAGWLE
jgi:putative tricarboxylic transport membrane protein